MESSIGGGTPKNWIIRYWFFTFPGLLIMVFVLFVFCWYFIEFQAIKNVKPLDIARTAPEYSSSPSFSFPPTVPVTLNFFSSLTPWNDARTLRGDTQFSYLKAKKLQWDALKWGNACGKAKGTIETVATFGGPLYYCIAGKYADAGKTCAVNEDCISNRCLKLDYMGDEIYATNKPQKCAYYTNWDGQGMHF